MTFSISTVRPSPPEGINITSLLDSSGETRLIVSWSPPAQPVVGGVGGYVLNVSGDGGGCGCVSMNVSANTTNVICSGVNGTGQICSFEVRAISIDCRITSDFIMESIKLLLPPPTNINVSSGYRAEGSIRCIKVHFTGVQTPNVFYNVTVGRHPIFINSSSCDTANTCTLTDKQTSISEDFFNITVSACNRLGCGDTKIFPTQFPANAVTQNLFQIHPENRTVVCNLLSSFTPQPNTRCLVTYGHSPHDCVRYNNRFKVSTGYPGDTLTVAITENLQSGVEYCYSIFLEYKHTSFSINGVFECLSCDPLELIINSSALRISTNMTGGVISILNGIISFSGIDVGSTAEVICDNGYYSNGPTRYCANCNGEWSGNIQICHEIYDDEPIETTVGTPIPTVGLASEFESVNITFIVSLIITAFIITTMFCLGVILTGTFIKKHKSSYKSSQGNRACVTALRLDNVDNETAVTFELKVASNMEGHSSLEQKKDKELVPGMSEGLIFGEAHRAFVDKSQ